MFSIYRIHGVRPGRSSWIGAVLALALAAGPVGPARGEGTTGGLSPAQRNELAEHFGFAPLEAYKIEYGISQLRVADLNGDGRNDMVVVNNAKSTIEVLLQRADAPDVPEQPRDVNDLVNPWRFDKKPVSVTWRVDCLQVADVTGDQHPDLVFFGDPQELVVLPGKGDGGFLDAVTQRARDGLALSAALDIGDLNGDGRDDVALLAEADVLIFHQKESGGLNLPERTAHALDHPVALKLSDLNGDSRRDLIVLVSDGDYPLNVRFQDEYGNLGPMERIRLPNLRSGLFTTRAGRSAADLFGVESVSGRLKHWTFVAGEEHAEDQEWAVRYYPLPGRGDAEQSPLAIGDVDGDKWLDVVAADVDAARMLLFRQQRNAGLLPQRPFAGQIKMRDMRAFDTDDDGRSEIFALSAEEGFVARSVYAEDRLTFPKALPTVGKPQALDVARLTADGPAMLAYVAQTDQGAYELIVQRADAEGSDAARTPLPDLRDPPSAVRAVDVNRDGLGDVLVFAPYAPLTTLLQNDAGQFVVAGGASDAQKGLVKRATPAGYAYVDVDGDNRAEVLLAQQAFVRALYVNADGAWEILDQYNAPGASAQIEGVAAVRVAGHDRPHLAMYDKASREVHVFSPAAGGTYELLRSVDVGSFDLRRMTAAPLAGTGNDAVLLMDKRRMALVLPDVRPRRAHELSMYETSVKDGRMTWAAAGDLNHDGCSDLAVLEVNDHMVEILTFGPDDALVRAMKFRVFAKKQFRGGREAAEPSWVSIADVTGDGTDDLLIIAHDRILLYPGQ